MKGQPVSIPETLGRWIYVNEEYQKLICKHIICRRAIEPQQLVRRLSNEHQVGAMSPLVAGHFVGQLGWDNSILRVAGDGLAPQPYVRVVQPHGQDNIPTVHVMLESVIELCRPDG